MNGRQIRAGDNYTISVKLPHRNQSANFTAKCINRGSKPGWFRFELLANTSGGIAAKSLIGSTQEVAARSVLSRDSRPVPALRPVPSVRGRAYAKATSPAAKKRTAAKVRKEARYEKSELDSIVLLLAGLGITASMTADYRSMEIDAEDLPKLKRALVRTFGKSLLG